jgi:hypothetical protein
MELSWLSSWSALKLLNQRRRARSSAENKFLPFPTPWRGFLGLIIQTSQPIRPLSQQSYIKPLKRKEK